jgi:alpha-ribazole phosphatase
MKKLVFLRHGDIAGFHNRYLGITNAHLSEKGQEQAARAGRNLSMEKFDAIYCSPLDRCLETLKKLNRPENVFFDERIREINFGLWEGKTFAEINEQYPDVVSEWAKGDPAFRFPAGENISDFQDRVSDFAHQFYDVSGKNFLIISHGGVIRHLICAFLNISFDNYLYFRIDYGRFILLDLYSEGGVLTGLNRRCIDG